jgi:hypothetical protein
MIAYAYNAETKVIAMEIKGDDIPSIEDIFNEYFDPDKFGLTYSPDFGANEGLINNGDFETIDVRA